MNFQSGRYTVGFIAPGAISNNYRLTCCLCGIRQSKAWYSKASLAALRQRVYREGNQILISNHAGLIRCCDCSGNPRQTERKCKICAELKSLDSFARNQRQYAEPVSVHCFLIHIYMCVDGDAWTVEFRTDQEWPFDRLAFLARTS